MDPASQTNPTPYIAEIRDALEVSLVATADLAFWKERLREENLVPFARDGQAEIVISSVQSRFLAIPFQELVFAVTVSRDPHGTTRDGCFLADAFNSSRLFAWIERMAFQTPYRAADVQLSPEPHPGILLRDTAGVVLEASRRSSLTCRIDEPWEGAIHLPARSAKPGRPRQQFFGRFRGEIHSAPFDAQDVFQISGAERHPVLRDLRDSHAVPREWRIRPKAAHARSRTVARSS